MEIMKSSHYFNHTKLLQPVLSISFMYIIMIIIIKFLGAFKNLNVLT
jgi:hypothetical protein